MLIGVPAAGKSTWINTQNLNGVVISTDNKIEAHAAKLGKTYNEVFESYIGAADVEMKRDLKAAVAANQNIIWDQTNTSKKKRAKCISMVPAHYSKVAVFFPVPADHAQRLASRPGKNIPPHVLASMIDRLEEPTIDEGWDRIIRVG